LPDSTLHAIPVGFVRRIVCAAPAYLKKSGTPATPQDLARHTVIAASPVSPIPEWRFGSGKKRVAVKVKARLTVSNNDAAINAALQGFGVTRLMSYQVASQLQARRLKRVLGEYEPPPLPIHVLHHEGRQASAKVRSFVDLLVARLRADAALN